MDKTYLTKLRTFYDRKRRMPTYVEFMKLTGFRSKNAVHKLIDRLIKAGYLEKDQNGHIAPTRAFSAIAVLGTVEAGFPSPAEEELIDTMTMDEYLIKNKDATYMLEVSGLSMIDAGIMPGDMVLVERGREPKDGDIVIAEVDHAWTMKYLRKKGKKIYLDPANKKFKRIEPKDDLRIAAVVISVVRKYK